MDYKSILPIAKPIFVPATFHVLTTRYLPSSHIRLVFSLKYPLSWLKVDAKWVYGSYRKFMAMYVARLFTKNKQINMVTHRVSYYSSLGIIK